MPTAKLIIITAPSGSGKTTMVKHIMSKCDNVVFSTSATTRPRRANEIDGREYHFLTKEEFLEKIENNAFVEWEEVYPGRFYGTLKSEVEGKISQGKNILFDIDIKGALNLKKIYPENSLAVFIKAPNLQTLIDRLSKRNSETPETLEMRIKKAKGEMLYRDSFDRVVVNDNLEKAFNEIEVVVKTFLGENT